MSLPEWQGFGLNTDVHRGTLALARELFGSESHVTIDVPLSEALDTSDRVLGLSSIAPRFESTLELIRRESPERLLTIGGTCGVELAPVAYLNERYAGDLTVLWLDAHADLNTPASSPSGHFHGMVLRTLTGEGPAALVQQLSRPLEPQQIMLVGVREFDPAELDFCAAHGVPNIMTAFTAPETLTNVLDARDRRRLYVHFDVDVLDPSHFDGALMHAYGAGPTLDQAMSLIRVLVSDFDVVGFSVLEYCERNVETTRALASALRALLAM